MILRPWFDYLALRLMVGTFFPLSRLWAAAEVAGHDVEAFAAAVPIEPLSGRARDRLGSALVDTSRRRELADRTENEWRDAAFSPGAVGDFGRIAVDRKRAVSHYMMARGRFRFLRRRAPAVDFKTVSLDLAQERYGRFLADPTDMFGAPAKPVIRQSRGVTDSDYHHSWLKFETPAASLGDTVWAHVFEPVGGYDHTIVMCHGLGIEADMWDGSLHMAPGFAGRRIRVIEPDAPWHGRRRPFGVYGGEPFVARGPAGAVEEFAAHVAEIACLIGWARETGPGQVGIGGISLGALNSQMVVAHGHQWPRDMRPDATMLITTTDRLDEVAWDGGFARGFGTPKAFAEAGWARNDVADWLPVTAPLGEPSIDPGKIVVVLGSHDTVTPFRGGREFVRRWQIPDDNLFIRRQGHFSAALGLARDGSPFGRFVDVLGS